MISTPPARRALALAALLGASAITSGASASDTDTLTVQASVVGTCTVTGNTLDFGTYDTADNSRADVGIDYDCSSPTNIVLSLGQGNNFDGLARGLKNGTEALLKYFLYKDSDLSSEWGDNAGTGSFGGIEIAAAETGTQQVFGLLGSGQAVPPGNYDDAVLITLTIN